MKKLVFILPIVLIFASCKCKKEASSSTNTTTTMIDSSKKILKSDCPTDGKCTTEIFRNKALDVKTDDIGAIYYNKIDNPNTSVIVYKYNRTVPEGVQDGNYSEEIVFEINNSDKSLVLNDAALQQTKMLFGRFCFCRGAAGNFKIEKGNLNLSQKNGEVSFQLEFKTTKVPQVIGVISEIIK